MPKGDASELALAGDGLIAARLMSDLILERSRSLMIEDWQDAADILASLRIRLNPPWQSRYAKEALTRANRLFTSGLLMESYRAAIQAEQLALPSAFELSAPGGHLLPYPISVHCPDAPVKAIVRAFGPRSTVVSIISSSAQTVTIRQGDIENSLDVSPNQSSDIRLDEVH